VSNSKIGEKAKATTSIVIVVSFDGLSESEYKIAMVRSDGSGDIQMKKVSLERDGMICIPVRYLKEMFSISGTKATEETKESGNE
jgi:hypothetical protein